MFAPTIALSRADWERRRRDDVRIHGLEPCLHLFGLEPPGVTRP